MVVRSKVTIPTLTGDKERTAYVYLPVGYDERWCGCGQSCKTEGRCTGRVYGECPAPVKCGVTKRYPVLYMFDGHNLFTDEEATFGKCWGLEKYLDEHKTQLIVCAVECNHEGDSRLSEYSPVPFDYHGKPVKGRGKKYMDWLTGVLKPSIDRDYRTLPDREHTFIGGSSMGGLMTIYALAKYGDIFSGGAGLSPSLWVQRGEVPSFIVNSKFRKGTVLFTDYGTKEFKNHSQQMKLFGETVKILIEKGVAVTSRIVPGGTHSEASWEREIPYFMSVLGLDESL